MERERQRDRIWKMSRVRRSLTRTYYASPLWIMHIAIRLLIFNCKKLITSQPSIHPAIGIITIEHHFLILLKPHHCKVWRGSDMQLITNKAFIPWWACILLMNWRLSLIMNEVIIKTLVHLALSAGKLNISYCSCDLDGLFHVRFSTAKVKSREHLWLWLFRFPRIIRKRKLRSQSILVHN